MENQVGVIDAKSLVENVHAIKRWVYDGSLQIHVPICGRFLLSITQMQDKVPGSWSRRDMLTHCPRISN